jgi:hypothetical protein
VSRPIPTALETEIEAPVVRPFLALRIELPDPVYVWTGQGTIQFADTDGTTQTWLGIGGLGALDTVGEATDGSATGIRATLFEVPSEMRDDIASQAVRGVLMEVYVGALNQTYQQVQATALMWKGRLDQYKITDGGNSLQVEVTGESRAIDQRRPAVKRFTDEYQQRKHPGDLFFQYVSRMTEIPILWAKGEASGAGLGGGAGLGAISGGNGSAVGGRLTNSV